MLCSGNPVLFNNASEELQAGVAKVADLIRERQRLNAEALAAPAEDALDDGPSSPAPTLLASQTEE